MPTPTPSQRPRPTKEEMKARLTALMYQALREDSDIKNKLLYWQITGEWPEDKR